MTEKLSFKVKTARSLHKFIRLGMFRLHRYREFFPALNWDLYTSRVRDNGANFEQFAASYWAKVSVN